MDEQSKKRFVRENTTTDSRNTPRNSRTNPRQNNAPELEAEVENPLSLLLSSLSPSIQEIISQILNLSREEQNNLLKIILLWLQLNPETQKKLATLHNELGRLNSEEHDELFVIIFDWLALDYTEQTDFWYIIGFMRQWQQLHDKARNGSLDQDEQDLLLEAMKASKFWLQKVSHILDESNDNDEQK
ncbi:hypothetical protein [Calothrix sp. CCY 0018]|uniref:hypothetical protein n=1 Tax=Calothrix sp. CCY 0018 TaxID=3103864 RepID=UPI0039C5DE86